MTSFFECPSTFFSSFARETFGERWVPKTGPTSFFYDLRKSIQTDQELETYLVYFHPENFKMNL